MHDIHRNALVSIFLRQLEYFQGILFLTTNRVEVSIYLSQKVFLHSFGLLTFGRQTFDDAFQSRIHIAPAL